MPLRLRGVRKDGSLSSLLPFLFPRRSGFVGLRRADGAKDSAFDNKTDTERCPRAHLPSIRSEALVQNGIVYFRLSVFRPQSCSYAAENADENLRDEGRRKFLHRLFNSALRGGKTSESTRPYPSIATRSASKGAHPGFWGDLCDRHWLESGKVTGPALRAINRDRPVKRSAQRVVFLLAVPPSSVWGGPPRPGRRQRRWPAPRHG